MEAYREFQRHKAKVAAAAAAKASLSSDINFSKKNGENILGLNLKFSEPTALDYYNSLVDVFDQTNTRIEQRARERATRIEHANKITLANKSKTESSGARHVPDSGAWKRFIYRAIISSSNELRLFVPKTVEACMDELNSELDNRRTQITREEIISELDMLHYLLNQIKPTTLGCEGYGMKPLKILFYLGLKTMIIISKEHEMVVDD